MSKYLMKTKIGQQEWQLINQVRDHTFICDDQEYDAGPNPVEYLCASVNSCIAMSAAMVAKSHRLNIKDFHLENEAETEDLGHGKSVVAWMHIKVFFASNMNEEDKEKFLAHVLHVSTVYQTVKHALSIEVKLA